VWDAIEKNPLCYIADNVLKDRHRNDHDDFFQLPYSLHDRDLVYKMLQGAGLVDISIMDESIKCYWSTAMEAAEAIIDGSPISLILKSRGEDLQPTLDLLSAAYLEHSQAQQESVQGVGIGFVMNAVIFMSFKPTS
jgi:hypothetical protein